MMELVSWDHEIPNIWKIGKIKKCLKPPTSMYIYVCMYIYIYVCSPPPGPTFFSISLTVSLQGQPSAICYLQKHTHNKANKTNNALESLLPSPHPKEGLPKLCVFFCYYIYINKINMPATLEQIFLPKTNQEERVAVRVSLTQNGHVSAVLYTFTGITFGKTSIYIYMLLYQFLVNIP